MSQTVRLMLVYMFYFECDLEAVTRWCSVKKEFLKILQNSPENTWEAWEACNFIKKETLAQLFSCEFCEISKNTSVGCFSDLCYSKN